MTVPLYNPVRIAENAAFIDILSNGRLTLGLGSGYRPYEFEGLGVPFDERRDIQEEAIPLVLDALHGRKLDHQGKYFRSKVGGDYQLFPVSLQRPHPPLYMAAGTERSIAFAASRGFGLMLSTLPSAEVLAGQIRFYRERVKQAPAPYDANPACNHVDIARWVYVAETDAQARVDSEAGILRHLAHFMGRSTAGYLGSVSEKGGADLNYDDLVATTLLHGSPETVTQKLRALAGTTGMDSLLLHYPPYYGTEKARKSLRLFAERIMPQFRG
jgi:alkanesulfonate monooxygenase SsuD/methylene tetrahydromethanopterin reductase-like flavin-dependent oxidoreductase (luciferase family)